MVLVSCNQLAINQFQQLSSDMKWIVLVIAPALLVNVCL